MQWLPHETVPKRVLIHVQCIHTFPIIFHWLHHICLYLTILVSNFSVQKKMQHYLIKIMCRISKVVFVCLFLIFPFITAFFYFYFYTLSQSPSHNHSFCLIPLTSFFLCFHLSSLYNMLFFFHHQSQNCLTAFLRMLHHWKSTWYVQILYRNHASAIYSTVINTFVNTDFLLFEQILI